MSDVPVSERTWFRHARTGDRGYLVVKDGKQFIRLDRPMEELLHPFRPDQGIWNPDNETRPFSKFQLAQVAFEADRQLCRMLGMHSTADRTWLAMKEQDRLKFIDKGPQGPDVRRDVYQAIMGVLAPLGG